MRLKNILFAVLLLGGSTLSANYTIQNLPVPGDFPAHLRPAFEPKKIENLLMPMTKDFLDSIESEYEKGPNFAGHCTVVSMGCGEHCEDLWIFDPTTGDLITHIMSLYGSQYSLDSKLLVVNVPSAEAKAYYNNSKFSPYWSNLETQYYALEGNDLKPIFKAPMSKFFQ